MRCLTQELASFVHQQAATNEWQSALIKEQSFMIQKQTETIDKQSALIQQLQEETGVSLVFSDYEKHY